MPSRAAAVLILFAATAASAHAGPGLPPPDPAVRRTSSTPLLPPVDGAIGRRFTAPGSDWGPGHRGIDFSASPGTPVRAAAAGDVTFAGSVGDLNAVTIAHGGNLETTYSSLDAVFVAEGDRVTAGSWVGAAGAAHPGGVGGVHFGVKYLGRYVDPERYLGPVDFAGAIYLVPDSDVYTGALAERFAAQPLDDRSRECTPLREVPSGAPAPNGNVAVVIAGLNSNRNDPVFSVPGRLGYRSGDVYRFSYRGNDGRRLFEPYTHSDTYRSLSLHEFGLADLLRKVGRRHPGRDVDLFAHSQGGLVARGTVASLAAEWDPDLPRIAHLITYATPHRGTRLADAPDVLEGGDAGFLLLDATRSAGFDPWATSIGQMRPGSPYLEDLASSDVTLGTRVLALSIPNDFIVPAHRAGWKGEASRTVPPEGGVFGHSAITRSEAADGMAYAFLRDAATPCEESDGSGAGPLISAGHRAAPWLLRWAERAAKKAVSDHPWGRAVVNIVKLGAFLRRR